MRNGIFADRLFLKKLIHLALPIAFQNLMLAAVAAADAFMLGNVEQNAMAAVSLASQIQFVQNVVLSSIVSACSIFGAQYWGKRDVKTLDDVFCMTLRISSAVSVVFFIGCVCFPVELMHLFASDAELISIGAHYLRIAGWSYLITGISQCYHAMMKVTGNAAFTAVISFGTVATNILLNGILIFGLHGIPALGVAGAASATLAARCIELIWVIAISQKRRIQGTNLRRILRRNTLLAGDYWKCLVPLLGSGLFWGIGFTSYTAFMGHLGADAAAGNSVAAVIRDLVCCLCNGIAYGGGILVGNELGAGKTGLAKLYGDRLVKMSFWGGGVSTLIMLILMPLILHLVKLNDGAGDYLAGMIVIMAIYMIGRTVNTVTINGIFAAGGDTMFDMYSLAICMWSLAIPLAALGTFVFHWPVLVVYACTCLDEVGKIPWVMVHYRKYKWLRDLTKDMPDEI